ncbi:MAG: sigma-54-dependent Fis family transcriptional regulator [Deltaproteobacteria bacterium]|nr:sigma-54-dependent Fis family transcriptional regulator [Deltaproteobacteria bacterium]
MRIVLVEDENILRVSLRNELEKSGHVVEDHERPASALAGLQREPCDLVLADIRLPGMDGFEFLEQARQVRPRVPFVFMTAFGTVRDAVRAMRLGAFDYLTKPFEVDELLVLLERIRSVRALEDENSALRRRVERCCREDELGSAPAMSRILADLPLVAGSDEIVLIAGETGTGKEHLARLIHGRSRRCDRSFVKVSCASLSPELIESELFGHEKGAYTGADQRVVGRFERSDGGTLMLDEIDDVPAGLQVKLLEVLQDGVIERVGGERPIRVDVRIIVATKADLGGLVEQGKFRRDLFYRINVLPMHLPPLRERLEDLPLLLERFLVRYAPGRAVQVAPEALDVLLAHPWPGNVRELENLVKRLLVLVPSGPIDVSALPLHIRHAAEAARATPSPRGRLDEVLARAERDLLLEALRRTGGNRTRAAEELGLAPSTFRDRLAKLGIE